MSNEELHSKFTRISYQLKKEFFERDHIIDAALIAILSKQHMLQLGVPGTAKSMVTDAICKRIQGASYFQWLLTRFSTPEELFGPVSLKGLENDEYRRITDGKLPQCHIAFIDEIFKGNAAILNSLLTAVNERAFDNGRKRETIPLISVFGASNELPEEDELSALYDRFILKFWVPYIQDGDNWEQLLLGTTRKSANETLTLDELSRAQNIVTQISVSPEIVHTMREIKLSLEREGIVASDRRWKQTVGVLRARAWLAGRDAVNTGDLELLCDMLWKEPEQRKVLVSKILSMTNPLDLEAVKYLDDCKDVYSQLSSATGSAEEIAEKLKLAMTKIDEVLKIADPLKIVKLKETRKTISQWYAETIKRITL